MLKRGIRWYDRHRADLAMESVDVHCDALICGYHHFLWNNLWSLLIVDDFIAVCKGLRLRWFVNKGAWGNFRLMTDFVTDTLQRQGGFLRFYHFWCLLCKPFSFCYPLNSSSFAWSLYFSRRIIKMSHVSSIALALGVWLCIWITYIQILNCLYYAAHDASRFIYNKLYMLIMICNYSLAWWDSDERSAELSQKISAISSTWKAHKLPLLIRKRQFSIAATSACASSMGCGNPKRSKCLYNLSLCVLSRRRCIFYYSLAVPASLVKI